MVELSALQDAGVTTFFNFQQRLEEKHSGRIWYYPKLLSHVFGHGDAQSRMRRFPVTDGGVWNLQTLTEIVDQAEAVISLV